MLDAPVVDVGVEVLADRLCEELSEVGAVVPEKGCYGLELDIVLIIVVNIAEDVIEDGISRRAVAAIHDGFDLLRYVQNDLVQVVAVLYAVDDGGVRGKRPP